MDHKEKQVLGEWGNTFHIFQFILDKTCKSDIGGVLFEILGHLFQYC